MQRALKEYQAFLGVEEHAEVPGADGGEDGDLDELESTALMNLPSDTSYLDDEV